MCKKKLHQASEKVTEVTPPLLGTEQEKNTAERHERATPVAALQSGAKIQSGREQGLPAGE